MILFNTPFVYYSPDSQTKNARQSQVSIPHNVLKYFSLAMKSKCTRLELRIGRNNIEHLQVMFSH